MTYKEAAIRLTLLLTEAGKYGVEVDEYAEAVAMGVSALNAGDRMEWGE